MIVKVTEVGRAVRKPTKMKFSFTLCAIDEKNFYESIGTLSAKVNEVLKKIDNLFKIKEKEYTLTKGGIYSKKLIAPFNKNDPQPEKDRIKGYKSSIFIEIVSELDVYTLVSLINTVSNDIEHFECGNYNFFLAKEDYISAYKEAVRNAIETGYKKACLIKSIEGKDGVTLENVSFMSTLGYFGADKKGKFAGDYTNISADDKVSLISENIVVNDCIVTESVCMKFSVGNLQ